MTMWRSIFMVGALLAALARWAGLVGTNLLDVYYGQAANPVQLGSAVAYAFATGLPRTVELDVN
jgi:hypothetical protein